MLLTASLLIALSLVAPDADAALRMRANELVAKLGDASYRVREKATAELLAIGYPARDALLLGQRSDDLEVSQRCKNLYPVIWKRDLDKRIAKFLNAKDASIPDDLPAARRWLEIVGDNRESRETYGVLMREHSDELLKIELQPEQTQQQYYDFARNYYTKFNTGPVPRAAIAEADILLFLFLGAVGEVRPPRVPAGMSSIYFTNFLTPVNFNDAILKNAATRKLLAAWLEKERYSITMRRGIDLAAQHKIRECLPAMIRVASDVGSTPLVRANALLGFGKVGTKDDLKLFEPFLVDKTVLAAAVIIVNNERGSVQMRDVALGAAVQAMGLNLADFGFERKIPAGLVTISYTYFAFGTDEKRDAAHQKWAEWVKANLKK